MGLMAALLLGLGWVASNQRVATDAGQRAARETVLLQEHLNARLLPAQGVLRQLGFGLLPGTTGEAARLQRSAAIIEELRANALLAAVYVAYPNGDFLLARPLRVASVRALVLAPDDAEFVVQTVTLRPDGQRVGTFHFMTGRGSFVNSRVDPSYQFDARARNWYQAAMEHPGQVAHTSPYRFFTSKQLGVTLSRATTDGDAVIGVDLAFDDIEDLLLQRRITPSARFALIHANGDVLASTSGTNSADRDRLPTLSDIREPELLLLQAAQQQDDQPAQLDIDGRRWLGLRARLDLGLGTQLTFLEVAPLDELAAEARRRLMYIIGIAVAMTATLLPLGWLAGRSIGHSLQRLRIRSMRIGRFDFGGDPLPSSVVREVNELSRAVQHMGDTIEAFLKLTEHLANEREMDRMLELVLLQLVQATQSEAAAVFLWDPKTQLMTNKSQVANLSAPLDSQFPYPMALDPRDALQSAGAFRHVDQELRGRDGTLKGLLVLEFAGDASHLDPAFLHFARRLSGMVAVAIETRQLIEAQRQLFDAIIQLMADAIDAKSAYTGGHCDRVPQLAVEFAEHLHQATEGPYADFRISETERYAFRIGAWLHDCGKVTSPEHIVDKSTKLELIYNRIHEVRLRFEILWRDAELAAARGEIGATELTSRQQQLVEDFAFLAECNLGGEFMADESIERLRSIGAQGWLRHFDDRLGLSQTELRQAESISPVAPAMPARETLLADKPQHRVPWGDASPPVRADDPRNVYGFDMQLPRYQQNQGELHNLSIRRGTLTEEDRFKINDHIVQTYIMLKGLPWPAGLEQVPEFAATHHERLDGKGYPRRLAAERLNVLDRVMALADIFEALTAADRPYKTPKSLSETLRIMANMCKDHHVDTELFRYFLHSRIWSGYAQRFMKPEQCDEVSIDKIEAILNKPATHGAA
jgi:HD-GYP domain-containing protein (c-di-GMP phosphodiesterase class II)